MPRVKYKKFQEKLEKASVFSLKTVQGEMGNGYAKVFIHRLREKGKIIPLIKGWYSFKETPYLITVPLGEAYIGLGTAAFLHGFWDQIPNVNVLTTKAPKKIKVGERIVGERKVIVRRVSRKMYFGYETMKVDGESVRVSDLEKTLIDMIYFNYPFLDDIWKAMAGSLNKKKLALYIRKTSGVRGHKKIKRKIHSLTKAG
ncbi:MAG: hypothetical protein ISS93_00100 [Candidatus Aenigmarchaeota archaeon]|nr:hypothetical protein [Candidatus Aenigmarchaeota archaeon]